MYFSGINIVEMDKKLAFRCKNLKDFPFTYLSKSSVGYFLCLSLMNTTNFNVILLPKFSNEFHQFSGSFTFEYRWYWGSKVDSPPWEIPQPIPWNIDWVKAGVMVCEHLKSNFYQWKLQYLMRNLVFDVWSCKWAKSWLYYLIDLKVCTIERKASSCSCSAWYLLTRTMINHTVCIILAVYSYEMTTIRVYGFSYQKSPSYCLRLCFTYAVAWGTSLIFT